MVGEGVTAAGTRCWRGVPGLCKVLSMSSGKVGSPRTVAKVSASMVGRSSDSLNEGSEVRSVSALALLGAP